MAPVIAESWQTIVRWCADRAPAVHAALAGPAPEADIRQAHDELGVPLPEDLLAWWRLSNGVYPEAVDAGPIIPPYYNPYSVLDALDSRRSWIGICGNGTDTALSDGRPDPALAPAGTQYYTGWLLAWLPIAYDQSGDRLFVDLRQGPLHGCVMEFDPENGTSQEPAWPSIAAMLADIAHGLVAGASIGPYRDHVELLDGGRLDWTDEQPT